MKQIEDIEASPAGVSVIICCYNSAARLPETLKHLARQVIPSSMAWEVIVVNNASTDDTTEIVRKLWQEAGNPAELRIVDEWKPGLSHAREAGVSNARYELVIFVDDDNWLAADYLKIVSELFSRIPQIGVLGGEITAAFEEPPPNWFFRMQSAFAVEPQGKESGDITDYKLHLAGAGMAIRKSAYEQLERRKFQFVLSDRRQKELTSGGDTELCMALVLLGYRVWYDSRLRLVHFMPKARLSRIHMLQVVRGAEASFPVIACYEAAIYQYGGSPWRSYILGICKHCWWALKSTAKLFLCRADWTLFQMEWAALWRFLNSLPQFLRAFKNHYPEIVRLRDGSRSDE